MFAWYKGISGNERRTFWACYGGWTLDALDTQMFSLVIPAIIATWGISKTAAGSAMSISLLASSLGGWIIGALADSFGRVRILQLTILCFSVFTFLSAFAQTLPQLLVIRAMQGFGFGGEWTVGTVLIAETVRSEHRGRVMGTLQSGWAVGWGLSVLLYGIVFSCVPPQTAWRVLFALGLLPSLLVVYIQRSIREPVRQPKPEIVTDKVGSFALLKIFAPKTLRITLIGGAIGFGAHGGYYALTTWLPAYLKIERHISVLGTSGYLAVIIIAFWCGCIAAAYFLDLLGRRKTILFFSICCTGTVATYLLLHVTNLQMLLLGFPLGFFSAGIPASMGALFSEIFPAGVRGTGVGFCYNFGRLLSAGLPALVGKISAGASLGFAIGITAVSAYSLVVLAVFFLPETGQQALRP